MRKPDDVRVVGPGKPLGQGSEVRDAELPVTVGEGDELVAGGPEARAERGAVAQVRRVVDDADEIGVRRCQFVGDGPGPVARTVVDRDDLEGVRQPGQRLSLLDEAGEVGLLVVRREEVRQARRARSRGVSRRPTTRHRLSGMGIGTGSMTNSSSSSRQSSRRIT